MRLVLLLAASLALATAGAAQVLPDTTSAARYYPLAVGNVWEYDVWVFGETLFERVHITGTEEQAGQLYFVREFTRFDEDGQPIAAPTVQRVRFDPESATVVYRDEASERPDTCPLNAPFNATITCLEWCNGTTTGGGYSLPVAIGETTLTANQKYFDTQGCEAQYGYIADIGLGSWGAWINHGTLRYARVGEAEYGAPFPVTVEEPLSSGDRVRLSAYPNPARGALSIAVTTERPAEMRVAVYDALGRRVAVLHEGAMAQGTHHLALPATALAAGTYQVRALGPHTDEGVTITLVP